MSTQRSWGRSAACFFYFFRVPAFAGMTLWGGEVWSLRDDLRYHYANLVGHLSSAAITSIACFVIVLMVASS